MDFSKQDGTPSVKLHHAPGGKSSFSLAWDAEPQQTVGQGKKQVVMQQNIIQQNQPVQKNVQSQPEPYKSSAQTSVKVHAPPGGKSSFTFGWSIHVLFLKNFWMKNLLQIWVKKSNDFDKFR